MSAHYSIDELKKIISPIANKYQIFIQKSRAHLE